MQSINLKSSASHAAVAGSAKPGQSVWRSKLEAAQSDSLAKLLQRAGVISKEQYCDAMEIADSIKKSVDQVIVTSFLNEKESELCAAAMSHIERGAVTEELATDALRLANTKGIKFADGLKYFGYGW